MMIVIVMMMMMMMILMTMTIKSARVTAWLQQQAQDMHTQQHWSHLPIQFYPIPYHLHDDHDGCSAVAVRIKIVNMQICQECSSEESSIELLDNWQYTIFTAIILLTGGTLSNRKGVNTPTIVLPISPMTPKDRTYVQFSVGTKR